MLRSQTIFTSNGTWTAQAGVYFIEIEGIGAGGGGGGGRTGPNAISQSPLGGAGGGAGIMQKVIVPVVPGTTYNIIIGTAGTAGSGGYALGSLPTSGGAGGNTTFTTGGGTVLAAFVGGGGGAASDGMSNAGGLNTIGGQPASNPYSYPGFSTSLGTIAAYQAQPRIMIGEGGTGGESNTTVRMQGIAGSNYIAYNNAGFSGGTRGTSGGDSGSYYGGGVGGGGAASYYGSGGGGGNGGNASSLGIGSNGTTGTAPSGTAYGAGGGGGGAGGSGAGGGGTGANGAVGIAGYMVIRWEE